MRAWRYVGAAAVVVVCAGAAHADQAASEKWFAAKSIDQRTLIQAELILVNEYSGLADGRFGGATFEALAAYQMHRGATADGVLTAAQEAELTQRAARSYSLLGLKPVTDAVTGITVPLPMGLLMMSSPAESGTTWTAGGDNGLAVTLQAVPEKDLALKDLYARLAEGSSRILFGELQADRFRIAGGLGGSRDYLAAFVFKDGVSRGVTVSWLPRLQLLGPMAATYLVSMMLSPSLGPADAILAAAAAKLPPPVQPAPPPAAAGAAPGGAPPAGTPPGLPGTR